MRNPNSVVSDPNSFISNPGDQFHVNYSPRVLDSGEIKLVESGKDDIKQKINSFRDSTDMSFILQRLAVGDTSVLNQRPGMFGDFTQMPTTYAEALQLVIDGRREFDALPLDVKNSFNNDFRQFLASAGTPEWHEKLSSLRPKSDKVSTIPDDVTTPSVNVTMPSVNVTTPSAEVDKKE